MISTPDNLTWRLKSEAMAVPPLTCLIICNVAKGDTHIGAVIVTALPVVIVPAPSERALPVHTVLAPIVIALALSMIVPTNVVVAPSVVAAVGVQKTSQADAPISVILELSVVVSAQVVLNIYVPAPLSVIPHTPMVIAPTLQYTPGGYTPVAPFGQSTERLTAPPGKLNVHNCPLSPGESAVAASVRAVGVGAPAP